MKVYVVRNGRITAMGYADTHIDAISLARTIAAYQLRSNRK